MSANEKRHGEIAGRASLGVASLGANHVLGVDDVGPAGVVVGPAGLAIRVLVIF